MDARHVAVIGNTHHRLQRREAWEPAQVAGGNDSLLEVIDVVGDEAATPIVEDQPETAAGVEGRGEVAGRRIEAEIEIPQWDRRANLAG